MVYSGNAFRLLFKLQKQGDNVAILPIDVYEMFLRQYLHGQTTPDGESTRINLTNGSVTEWASGGCLRTLIGVGKQPSFTFTHGFLTSHACCMMLMSRTLSAVMMIKIQ